MNDRLPATLIAPAGDLFEVPQGVSMSQYRPRRSMLYVPACVPRFLAKGRTLKVDSLIFDLEESVLVERKLEARRNAAAALKEGGYGHREVVVRVNRHDSAWGLDDLTAIAPLKPEPSSSRASKAVVTCWMRSPPWMRRAATTFR